VWDLKMGQILYTMYGHEGPAACVNFSQCGDFFASGGTDCTLMIWKSNVDSMDQELEGIGGLGTKLKTNKKRVNLEEGKCDHGSVNINLKSENTNIRESNKFKVTVENSKKNAGDKSEKFENLNFGSKY
jgi:WD40 repeat protein